MKRRALFIRTLTTAASASVFTAVGWLMGTKTLTMNPPPTPCSGGIVVEHSSQPKCIGAQCPDWAGFCGYDCYKFWCPGGYYVWACNNETENQCCSAANCP